MNSAPRPTSQRTAVIMRSSPRADRESRQRSSDAWSLRIGPLSRPGIERLQRGGEPTAERGEFVAVVVPLHHEARDRELSEPVIEHAGRQALTPTQQITGPYWPTAQFPQDSQRPAAPQKIECRHERPAGRRATHRQPRSWNGDIVVRFDNQNTTGKCPPKGSRSVHPISRC